jgi:DNA-binding NarL/FixJ family response regulator
MQINSGDLAYPVAGFAGPFFLEGRSPSSPNGRDEPGEKRVESGASGQPTVLLVDDNEMVLLRAKAALSARCVVLGMARDGRKALEAAATLQPSVVVLDISMPGMNGFELAKRLRDAGAAARLVFLTVHDEEEFVDAAKSVGALGYVLKSRLSEDLEKAVFAARDGQTFQSPVGG